MVGILSSRSVLQRVAEQCSIMQYYRIRNKSAEAAVKTLGGMTSMKTGDEGIVRISVEAKTRELAAKVANAYAAELDSFLRHSNISRGRSVRVFIERRLADVEKSLAEARDSLRAFQQRNNVTSVDDETKAAIDEYAKMQSQISVKQATLAAAQEVSGSDNPYVTSLTHEIAALRAQLRHLEEGSAEGGFGVGFGVSFQRLPAVAAEYARRYQDYRIQEEAYAALYEQYEYARILEARDAPAITVLDYAVPPERHSSPRRFLIVAATCLFALLAGCAFAFVSEYFDNMRRTTPEDFARWAELGGNLRQLLHRLRVRRTPPQPK
jgi:capsule polysaccharide export protein KpsE/RkpR